MRTTFWLLPLTLLSALAQAQTTPNPILFVTQVPVPVDFAAVGSTFANHIANMNSVYRGGDLWIRYPNGTLRNLTAEAGFGMNGFQGANAIAVRDPHVHWNGTKAVFSMVVGAPPQQFQVLSFRWQLYEVSGLGQGQQVSITLVPNQPTQFNNVNPAYLSDGSIVFASDRPRNGALHLYPQHDEYESTATVTGLWRLDPATGALKLLDHSPSGDFDPLVDSFGRVLFTRWDHLQRDQQSDQAGNPNQSFDWVSEEANAAIAPGLTEPFPEPRVAAVGSTVNGHRFNNFFPWQLAQDGTEAEFLNHLGRHEFHTYFDRAFNNDANLVEFIAEVSGRTNPNAIENLFQIVEDPTQPGRYLGIDAPEFDSHAAGQLVRLVAPPSANPDDIVIEYLTPRSTFGTAPAADHSGHYRNPLVLSDGSIVVAHTTAQGGVDNLGSPTAPVPSYRFRIKLMTTGTGGFLTAGASLTAGINKTVNWWDPDQMVSYTGELWELSPVEVRARTVPPASSEPATAGPELSAFATAGVAESTLRRFLRQQNLGLIVVRNNTHRDKADKQQPFNLRVPGGVQTVGSGGTLYDIAHFQLIQGDQVRGLGGSASPNLGRRVVSRFLHEPAALANNLPNAGGPAGSAPIFPDGSTALFVPTQRALSWQTTAPNGTPVVRERFWLTLQPGEIRECGGCHGINRTGQAAQAAATNTPQALTALLQNWSALNGGLMFADGLE
ncbi:MAG: PD40 domain-containing protein [Rhodanobacteraceae bacterium]|nr:PD40 domain-containing protein [Rhodanobacteraceae bacterium]